MSLCKSIDTLAMAYLDDELAAEERHELEAHLTECAACRAHARARARRPQHDLGARSSRRRRPTCCARGIGRALDERGSRGHKEQRRRWSAYLLPGSAMLAAAAAIAMFVGVKPPGAARGRATSARGRGQQTRGQLPLEVQGAEHRHVAAARTSQLEPAAVERQHLLGARLLPHGINGHDGAMMRSRSDPEGRRFVATVLAVTRYSRRGDAGWRRRSEDRRAHAARESQQDGQTVVSYVRFRWHIGFLYMAPDVGHTNDRLALARRRSSEASYAAPVSAANSDMIAAGHEPTRSLDRCRYGFRDTLTRELGRYKGVVVMTEADARSRARDRGGRCAVLIVIAVEEPDKSGFKTFQKCKKGAPRRCRSCSSPRAMSAEASRSTAASRSTPTSTSTSARLRRTSSSARSTT